MAPLKPALFEHLSTTAAGPVRNLINPATAQPSSVGLILLLLLLFVVIR